MNDALRQGRHTAVAVLCTLGVVLGSCGGPGGSSTASTGAPASRTTGCGRSAAPGSSTFHLTVDGYRRLVIVHVPAGYRPSVATPLVLNMHGTGSTAAQQEALTGMDATSDQSGFLVAYPQALLPSGSGFDWNVPGVPLFGGAPVPIHAADDVVFLTRLVTILSARYCVDLDRVFATGISGGGRMASQLACDASGTFAAVAPVAGLRFPSPCPATRAVPVVAFHGTADLIDPYDGGGQAYWTYSVPTAAQRWATYDACGNLQTTSGTGYSLTHYGGCNSGADVDLYTIASEGHEWPGGPHLPPGVTRLLGPQSDAVAANATMWAFFSAHPRPETAG